MDSQPLYLDNAATTPLDQRVFEAMLPWLRDEFGNPSSIHAHGRRAKIAVERARVHVAALIGADPSEIVFTSGGTESNNTAIAMATDTRRGHEKAETGNGGARSISSSAEHQAVLKPLEHRSHMGETVAWLPVNHAAVPELNAFSAHVGTETRLLTLMHVNNETGGILPLDKAAELAGTHDVSFHTDMVQSAGKLVIDIHAIGIDFASLSAHKLHGPKGTGALYVRGGIDADAIVRGGAQERGRRGGTENVPGIVGFGEAARLALMEREERLERWRDFRSEAVRMLLDAFAHIIVNGDGNDVLPSILSVSFPSSHYDIDGEMLPVRCDLAGLAISSGSACTAGSVAPSHVMRAIGHDERTAGASVRLSFGRTTMREDVRRGTGILIEVVQEMAGPSSRRSHSRMTMP